MAQKDNILQELNELQSSLANAGVQNAYRVPDGYFENLPAWVMSRIRAMEAENAAEELSHLSPVLSGISKKMPYTVSADFFNSIDEKVSEITNNETELSAEEELKGLSPLLSSLKKEMPYSVPAGYFENIDTPASTTTTQAKVVPMTRQKWFRYAAAAMVIGLVVLAGFLIFSSSTIDPSKKSYAWVEKNTKKISTDDIDKFVQLVDEGTPVLAKVDVNENMPEINEIKELVKDVPEKDLQNFLDETESLIDDPADEDALMN